MTAELVFYTNPASRGRIVRWMLEEVGAPYRTEILDYGPAMKSAAYLAINPMGKVPALRHGDTVVTECAAICAYLADAFPDAGLAPPPAQRGAYYRWLFFGAGPVEAAVMNQACGFEPSDEQRMMLGYGSLAAVADALEQAVSTQSYICGERFTAADVYVGSEIGFGMQYGHFDQRSAFQSYWSRISGRAARKRAEELDNLAMAEAGAPSQGGAR